MKTTAASVARALIETCRPLRESEYPAVVDAALAILMENGLGKEMRTFPRTVIQVLRKTEKVIPATLQTPTGDTDGMELAIVMALQTALGGTVELLAEREPSLLGGALLQVGDERFDASVKGALDRMKNHLSTTVA